MLIDFSQAVEGEYYVLHETLPLDKKLLGNRNGHFTEPAKIDGWYMVKDGKVTVSFQLIAKAVVPCDRCLTPTDIDFDIPVNEMFFKEKIDENCYIYENEQIELLPVINENIMFAVPSRVLCKEDCKGLCHNCGKNLNEGECDCDILDRTEDKINNNPFSVLKNMNKNSGGATHGSTKKKNIKSQKK